MIKHSSQILTSEKEATTKFAINVCLAPFFWGGVWGETFRFILFQIFLSCLFNLAFPLCVGRGDPQPQADQAVRRGEFRTRPEGAESGEPRADGGLPAPLLPAADKPHLPGQADLRDAAEQDHKVHGGRHLLPLQLRGQPTRGVPAAQALQDRSGGGD